MALGPSIFLPCNHSGTFIITYFQKRSHSIIKDNKITSPKIKLLSHCYNCIKLAKCKPRFNECAQIAFVNKSKTIRNDLSLISHSISGGVWWKFYVEFIFLTFLQVFVSFLVHHKLGLRFVYGLLFFVLLGKFHK